MAVERFDRQLRVASDRNLAWTVLTDVRELTSWVGIVHQTVEVERLSNYTAVLQDRIGPFKLRADLDIAVTVPDEYAEIHVYASGRDRSVDTKLVIDATLRLSTVDAGGTNIQVEGEYKVTGRVAAMGSGVIRKKAEQILEDFFSSAGRALNS
jgi:carbon monoxide dehydrogenase subunit G